MCVCVCVRVCVCADVERGLAIASFDQMEQLEKSGEPIFFVFLRRSRNPSPRICGQTGMHPDLGLQDCLQSSVNALGLLLGQ